MTIKSYLTTLALAGTLSFTQAQDSSLTKIVYATEDTVNVDGNSFVIPKRLSESFEKYPCEFLDIHEYTNKDTTIFWLLPDKQMDQHSSEIVALAEKYKEETWGVYSYIKQLTNKYTSKPKSFTEALDFISELNEEFGITHFYRYKYTNFMQNNLDNLSFMYDSRKPVALVIHTKSDRNHTKNMRDHRAFSHSKWRKNLRELSEGYKVFIYEVDNDSAAFSAIKKTSERYKDISVLILGGHGTSSTLRLKKSGMIFGKKGVVTKETLKPYENCYLDITDGKEFKEHAKYLKEDAMIILASCSTGQYKESGENLTNIIAKSFLGRTVYAPVDIAQTPDLIFNDFFCGSTLKDVKYKNKIGEKVETYKIKLD